MELGDLTGVKVLGVVRATRSGEALALRRRGYLTYAVGCALLFVALVAVVFVGMRYSPLNIGIVPGGAA
jgi:hypothetical protein